MLQYWIAALEDHLTVLDLWHCLQRARMTSLCIVALCLTQQRFNRLTGCSDTKLIRWMSYARDVAGAAVNSIS